MLAVPADRFDNRERMIHLGRAEHSVSYKGIAHVGEHNLKLVLGHPSRTEECVPILQWRPHWRLVHAWHLNRRIDIRKVLSIELLSLRSEITTVMNRSTPSIVRDGEQVPANRATPATHYIRRLSVADEKERPP